MNNDEAAEAGYLIGRDLADSLSDEQREAIRQGAERWMATSPWSAEREAAQHERSMFIEDDGTIVQARTEEHYRPLDEALRTIDDGLGDQSSDESTMYADVAPSTGTGCIRTGCRAGREDGSDFCGPCRKFMLGDTDEDPLDKPAVLPQSRYRLPNNVPYWFTGSWVDLPFPGPTHTYTRPVTGGPVRGGGSVHAEFIDEIPSEPQPLFEVELTSDEIPPDFLSALLGQPTEAQQQAARAQAQALATVTAHGFVFPTAEEALEVLGFEF